MTVGGSVVTDCTSLCGHGCADVSSCRARSGGDNPASYNGVKRLMWLCDDFVRLSAICRTSFSLDLEVPPANL